MTRVRLRGAYGDAMLALLYARPHSHDRWPDHVDRVAATIELARELIDLTGPPSVIADLSCGDATIARTLGGDGDLMAPARRVILGDIAPGYEMHGPIEQTISRVSDVGLFICTETLEHLDDPDWVLAAIRDRAAALVCSVPYGEFSTCNPEHYWAWDADGLRNVLLETGWIPRLYRMTATDASGATWRYQIWGCT